MKSVGAVAALVLIASSAAHAEPAPQWQAHVGASYTRVGHVDYVTDGHGPDWPGQGIGVDGDVWRPLRPWLRVGAGARYQMLLSGRDRLDYAHNLAIPLLVGFVWNLGVPDRELSLELGLGLDMAWYTEIRDFDTLGGGPLYIQGIRGELAIGYSEPINPDLAIIVQVRLQVAPGEAQNGDAYFRNASGASASIPVRLSLRWRF
jgi:hypothetical protein